MPKANVTHDITLETVGDTTSRRGFMLAQNRNRVRGHRVSDAQTIQPRQLTMGELTEAESPPDIALYWSQEDWKLGLGGINHRLHPKKLAIANKIDASDGFIRSARNLTEVTDIGMATTTDVRPTGFAKVGTEVWAFIGREVYQRDTPTSFAEGTTPDACTASIRRNGVEFAGDTYVASWNPSNDTPLPYIYKADADANWTEHPGVTAPNDFKYFAKGRNASGTEILYGAYQGSNVHHVYTSTDGTTDTAATWSGPTAIGESDSEITALVEDGDTILVCKTNGVWALYSDGTTKNLTPEFSRMEHSDNFRNAFNWNGHIILPLGTGGLVELVGGRIVDISIQRYMPEQTDLHYRRILAVHGEPTSLFLLVADGGLDAYLFMLKWEEFQGHRDFRWHRVGEITTTGGYIADHCSLFADGTPDNALVIHRIWIAIDGIDEDVMPFFFPFADDTSRTFNNDADQLAITEEWDGNFPRISKTLQQVDFEVKNLGSEGRVVAVDYRLDKGSWTSLGTLSSTATNQSLSFADGIDCKILELRFKPTQTSNDVDSAPEIHQFRVTAQLRPTRVELLPIALYLADNMTLLNGATAGRVKGDLSQIRTWADGPDEVIVTDSEGVSRDMVVLPGTLRVEEVGHQLGRRSEYIVRFTLAEVE